MPQRPWVATRSCCGYHIKDLYIDTFDEMAAATGRTKKILEARTDATSVALGYARVSTTEQARSGLGLHAQRTAIDGWAVSHGPAVEHYSENGESGMAAPDERPVLGALLMRLADPTDPATTLVVSRLDRLGRSVVDVLNLLDRAEREGWHLVMLDIAVDTTTPAGLMVATVMAAMARMERDMTAQRTRDALAAKKVAGVRLGRPASQATRDAARRIAVLAAHGMSQRDIARRLTAEQYPRATKTAGPWTARAVGLALRTARLDQEAEANAARYNAAQPNR